MKPYYDHGGITIYHGDSLDVLATVRDVDAVVTDPPFKLSQEYSASTDADNLLAVASVWPMASLLLCAARPGAVAAVVYDNRILPLGIDAFRRSGWKYLRMLTLYRRWGAACQVGGWMSTSDPVPVFVKPGAKPTFHGSCAHDVYVKSGPESEDAGHPAQKPLAFMRQLVQRLAPVGGLVIDPYMGSGTTLVAALAEGRRCIGIEQQERYCEIAAKRLQQEVLPLGVSA